MKVNKKRLLPILIGAVFLVGGVFAYFTQSLLVHNRYATPVYDTRIEEEFQSPEKWLPGQAINKDVWIQNNSTIPVYAKVVLKQEWIRTDTIFDGKGNPIPPLKGERLPLTFIAGNGAEQYAAQILWGDDVVLLNPNRGDIAKKVLSGVVRKNYRKNIQAERLPIVDDVSAAEGKWLLMTETPNEEGEIEAYYIGAIKDGSMSPLLVDSVTMNPLIEASVTRKDTRYDAQTKTWSTVETRNGSESYEAARYTLTITAETVQATKEAAEEVFGAQASEVVSELARHEIPVKEVKAKRLTFEKSNGKMVWSKKDETGENLFMLFENMLPGQTVTDHAIIQNKSNKKYDLYMRIVPVEQEEKLDELLEHIAMQVFYEGKSIYKGTAAGTDYHNGSWNLRKVVKLARVNPKDTSKIKVVLALDKDITTEYADMITKIDWEFMVTEVQSGKPPQPITGDSTALGKRLAILIFAVILLALLWAIKRSKRKQ